MISLIVAAAENGAIGKDNALMWRLSADLKRFKEITTAHTIIMGRKTYESIGKPLPNRQNIVVSRAKNYEVAGCKTAQNINDALKLAQSQEVFVIGGGEIYKQYLPIAQRIYLTVVHTVCADAHAFFAIPDPAQWREVSRVRHSAEPPKNEFDYSFVLLERIAAPKV